MIPKDKKIKEDIYVQCILVNQNKGFPPSHQQIRRDFQNTLNSLFINIYLCAMIFLLALPASQTHDSHKKRMILNHESAAGRIKNCGEKSAFSIRNFRFECFLTCQPCLE